MLTQKYVRTIFHYDEESGWLFWKWHENIADNTNYRMCGQVAGTVCLYACGKLYITIKIDGNNYLAHRIIWLYVYGDLPENIDHHDDDGTNNRLYNLRKATRSQNMANRAAPKLGVEKHGRKYRARVKVDGFKIELGSFDTWEEARKAYLEGQEKYFGEFAYHNRLLT